MYNKTMNSWLKHLDFIILDLVCLHISLRIAYGIRHGHFAFSQNEAYRILSVVIAIIQLLVIFCDETYSGVLHRGVISEIRQTVTHGVRVMLLVILYMFFMKLSSDYSRVFFVILWICYILLGCCTRILWKKHLKSRKYTEQEMRSLLIVAKEKDAETVLHAIEEKYRSFRIAGIVITDRDMTGASIGDTLVVANEESAVSFIHKNWVDEVFFALADTDAMPVPMINACRSMGVVTHIQLAALDTLGKDQIVEEIAGYMVLSSGPRMVSVSQRFLKRTMDIFGGLVGCLFTAILYVFVAPAIKLKSPGPVFFSQTRVGKNGRPFKIYKFRSMYMDAEERKKELMEQNNIEDGRMFKMDNDPRVIKGIGTFIRKTSIDEFPQFWNVLKGDMSLVGTRPPTLDEWEKYELHHRKRLAIKPGITGSWQVSGRSNITDFEKVVELDTRYIEEWSITLDLEILAKTVLVVLVGAGAK